MVADLRFASGATHVLLEPRRPAFAFSHGVNLRLPGTCALVWTSLVLAGCGGGDGHVETPTMPTPPTVASAPAFAPDPRAWGRFHSKRFALVVPLPEGKSWRID